MANIKYQVFVSSTYSDLVEERQIVSRAILDMGHIAAGMEMFPAADVEQLTYIKKVIDECDYYILIVGARYGSLDPAGISFTEREYDYAVDQGKTVLAFIHSNTDEIPFGKTDKDPQKYEKLMSFKEKITTGRLVKFWDNPIALAAQAILTLNKAFAENPQEGWVRASTLPTESTMADMLKLREENERLRKSLQEIETVLQPVFTDAADISQNIEIGYRFFNGDRYQSGTESISFADFLRIAAPALHAPSTIEQVVASVKTGLIERYDVPNRSTSINNSSVQDGLLHLFATGHVKMWPATTIGGMKDVTGYQLTPQGTRTWQELSYTRKS